MHITVRGQGPDVVMLHGWSMHSAVWHDLADALSGHFTLHLVDLPGHGQSNWQPGDFELDRVLKQLASDLPEMAHWLGWSLGGVISLAFSQRFPDRVNKLILLAATPCFVQKPDWSQAMQAKVFQDFSNKLKHDQAGTLQRFLLLQARGSDHSRETIKTLAAQLVAQGPAHAEALAEGLSLLINLDMRVALSDLRCPVKLVLGQQDTLIPQAMVDDALSLNASLETAVIPGAGHAPFVSHPAECMSSVMAFLKPETRHD